MIARYVLMYCALLFWPLSFFKNISSYAFNSFLSIVGLVGVAVIIAIKSVCKPVVRAHLFMYVSWVFVSVTNSEGVRCDIYTHIHFSLVRTSPSTCRSMEAGYPSLVAARYRH